jgi:hypothetical protein
MKPEDRERLKEKEKAHLREIQQLKQRLREAERVRSIGKALNDVESAGSMDELDEALSKVQLEALEGEAKLDMALDASATQTPGQKFDPIELEAESSKARAEELVRHMKISMGMEGLDSKTGGTQESDDSGDDPEDADQSDGSVAKTIGRMKPGDE